MLTDAQITVLVDGPGIVGQAVRAFLAGISDMTETRARDHFHTERAFYKWNAATQGAILRGIRLNYGAPLSRRGQASLKERLLAAFSDEQRRTAQTMRTLKRGTQRG